MSLAKNDQDPAHHVNNMSYNAIPFALPNKKNNVIASAAKKSLECFLAMPEDLWQSHMTMNGPGKGTIGKNRSPSPLPQKNSCLHRRTEEPLLHIGICSNP